MSWLSEHVETNWLPGQWDSTAWLFTADPADPRNTAQHCSAKGCVTVIAKSRLCRRCHEEYKEWGVPYDEFIDKYVAGVRKRHPADSGLARCLARKRKRCPRKEVQSGLCRTHYNTWRSMVKRDAAWTLEKWLAARNFNIPADVLPDCAVPECGRDAYFAGRTLCNLHHSRYRRLNPGLSPQQWAKTETPYISCNQVCLGHLDERLRWEILYALQQRVKRGGRVDPSAVRAVADVMSNSPSFATLTEAEAALIISTRKEAGTGCHLAEFARSLRRAHDDMLGIAPHERLVWDLVDVGALKDPTLKGGTRRRTGIDFGKITQPWLRDLTMARCRDLPSNRITPLYRVTLVASRVLDQRSDRGVDGTLVSFQDADDIAGAIKNLKRRDGKACASSTKRGLYLKFFDMIAFGRRQGLLEGMPASFGRDRSHAFSVERDEANEEYGKSIPLDVVLQLDANIDALGRADKYSGLTDEQRHQMFVAMYILLRDTGRRTNEIASLKLDYLTSDANGPILIYDNHKSGRLKRRLPILQSTAEVLKSWLDVRQTLTDIHSAGRPYVFPGTSSWQSHVRTQKIGEVFRAWIDGINEICGPGYDSDGRPIPFERKRINARALRHTYAQRHADNGTPVDVLRVLMDHTSIQTTGLYYVVNTDRKREAINTVGKYTVDRAGNAQPLTEQTRYQLRSVAVPFGNCTEPTNVNAGGKSCPIRFQCAGCGFYRPDPSFIPAIEDHLNTLRGDRETALAIDVAPFVLDNLAAQITAFEDVLTKMRDRLRLLDPTERERVEGASIVLRKMRAIAALPIEDVSRESGIIRDE
ncbi:tyrosine-type recombinase/integrase [Mycobacteroides abscessus]|uniref:tyrosine-type recombinase/integrase n=1 Tax=Mycobacteroides abscessus TaxID=36809 RepID=UPI001402A8C3|nr:tyrosine-type recombinase/integrase [Mycobacteroides abscessus]